MHGAMVASVRFQKGPKIYVGKHTLKTKHNYRIYKKINVWTVIEQHQIMRLNYKIIVAFTVDIFTKTQNWRYWHYCQLCIPIYLQFPSLFAQYGISKYEIRYQFVKGIKFQGYRPHWSC